jgi:NTE family protein
MQRFCFLLVFCFSLSLLAQEQKESDVKVGVLLSGGGARGLAHVGVLKEIEKAGIQIDYIAGTSMGAVIGGLYASGYSASQIEEIVLAFDLNELITDNFPRRSKSFFEKEAAERYALTIPFDDFKFQFPSSISKGVNLYDEFVKKLAHVHSVTDFSELPTPFFCMATDIETGESVLLENGFLPLALNASSALPTLFDPIEINGKLYVDGGVTNNYPIDELKAKGVDYVIGVDVQSSLSDRSKLVSAANILMQINQITITNDIERKRTKTDLYIQPTLNDYSIISFNDAEAIIDAGEASSKKFAPVLEALAARQNTKATPKKHIPPATEIALSSVDFRGNSKYGQNYLNGKLRLKTPKVFSYEKIQDGINNIAATKNFRRFRYTFEKDTEDFYKMILNLEDQPFDTTIGVGVHYDDLYKSSALINISQKQMLFQNDLASFDFILGDNLRYKFNYYIDKGFYWSIGLESEFNQFSADLDKKASLINDQGGLDFQSSRFFISNLSNRFFVETLFREEFVFRVGVEHKKIIMRSSAAINSSEQYNYLDDSHYYNVYGMLNLDTRDDIHYPSSGVYFKGDFNLSFDSSSSRFKENHSVFSIAKAMMGYTVSIGKNYSFSISASGGFTIDTPNRKALNFMLGGYGNRFLNNIQPFLGYLPLHTNSNSYLKSSFLIDYIIGGDQHLKLTANIATTGDNVFQSDDWRTIKHTGYALGYGVNSFLGPIELTYSFSPEIEKGVWYFNLGWWF